jgi:anti-sigma B factor antagonist
MFNVDLSIRDVGGQAVVSQRGDLDLAQTPGVASHLIVAVAACGPSVIVDLAGLESLGYGGLGVLVRMLKWTRGNGGDLSLAAPQQQVRRVLDVTGLIDVFSVYPSVEQAAIGTRRPQPRPAAAVPPLPPGPAVGGHPTASAVIRYFADRPDMEPVGCGTLCVTPAENGAGQHQDKTRSGLMPPGCSARDPDPLTGSPL